MKMPEAKEKKRGGNDSVRKLAWNQKEKEGKIIKEANYCSRTYYFFVAIEEKTCLENLSSSLYTHAVCVQKDEKDNGGENYSLP